MCIFVSRPMKIVTFLRNNDYTPKRVVDFHLERDTFRIKIIKIVEDFDEKNYNNNGKPMKSSSILRVKPNCFIFSLLFFFIFFIFHFFQFFHFFIFFHFLSFSFIFFHFLSFSFILFHFLSCSLIFYHVLSFSFIFFHFLCLCWVLNVTTSLDSSNVKNQFLSPSRVVPLWASFPFFPPFFFSRFLFFFLAFCFSIFSHFLFISSVFDFFNVFHFLFSFFPKKKFLLFFFLVLLSNIFYCWR